MFETGIAGDRITNLTGKIDLPDFARMVAKVDLFIGNDTGSTHIASGTGVRTICLFAGPGPLGRNVLRHANSTTLYVKLSCNMCSHVRVSDCPNDFLCAKAIGVDRVFDLALAKLDRWKARQVDTLR
jgi:ADP-heptose:LPS heptosyltransferase